MPGFKNLPINYNNNYAPTQIKNLLNQIIQSVKTRKKPGQCQAYYTNSSHLNSSSNNNTISILSQDRKISIVSGNNCNNMRFWAVSDLHTDYADNYLWCQNLSTNDFTEDCLIVAGDVTDDLDKLKRTLVCLKERFREVFFTPGNHELWLRMPQRAEMDSLEKLELIMELCTRIGVRTQATLLEGVWVVPILSWYHSSWDKLPDIPDSVPIEKAMVDFQLCQWPDGLQEESLAAHFDYLNNTPQYSKLVTNLNQYDDRSDRPFVISFSHFLPLQQLLPGKLFLRYANLHKAAGSEFLRERVENLQPDVHIFGHTHIRCDKYINGTRYIQWPLGYPRERKMWNVDIEDQTLILLRDTSLLENNELSQALQN
eukprot:TRINITY_DN23164_c0_g1_i1.p1 TRINITY_DN23164_c0_g1~~TRINITY_DN23164_c0_g1_i1.p1  ORF type:complete len:370 (-),score=38.91 TRINITY_DN23164_c0_g1_i1:977-2086(-)